MCVCESPCVMCARVRVRVCARCMKFDRMYDANVGCQMSRSNGESNGDMQYTTGTMLRVFAYVVKI